MLESMRAKLRGLGLVARGAATAAAAAVLVMTAGVTGVAPRPVNNVVQATVTSVTPFDLTSQGKTETSDADSETEADHGDDGQGQGEPDRDASSVDRAPTETDLGGDTAGDGDGTGDAGLDPPAEQGGQDEVVPDNPPEPPASSDEPAPESEPDPWDDAWETWVEDNPFIPRPPDDTESDDGAFWGG